MNELKHTSKRPGLSIVIFVGLLVIGGASCTNQTQILQGKQPARGEPSPKECSAEQERANKALIKAFIDEGQSGRDLEAVAKYSSVDMVLSEYERLKMQ